MEGTPIVCPHCLGSILDDENVWICEHCGRRFRSLLGIPDLRTREDEFLSNETDWHLALRLAAEFDRLDFRGLLDRYYDLSPEIPDHLRERQIRHILESGSRLESWRTAHDDADGAGSILDLGTGTASWLVRASAAGVSSIGVDIAMRWLVLARKRLDEAGLSRVRLVCACAERLPFATASFARIVAGDVIEHVGDQAATLGEAFRVLRPGGRLVMTTPNRWSLAPEPHVGVWGVGFLPRRWMPRYVGWISGRDFRAIRCLSAPEWIRLLERSPFRGGSIIPPPLGDEDTRFGSWTRRLLARAYNRLVSGRLGCAAAVLFGPLFLIVCRKPDPGPRQPAPPFAKTPGRHDRGERRACTVERVS